MKQTSLRFKLMMSFLLAGLLPMLVVGIYSYTKSSATIEEEAVSKLVAVRNIKGDAVKRYFESIRDQVLTFSHDVMIEDAMVSFGKAFKSFSEESGVTSEISTTHKEKLKSFYVKEFGKKYEADNGKSINATGLLNQLDSNQMALQYTYIKENSNPLGSKDALDRGRDSSTYSELHAKYHPSIREFLQKFGYYDIFLVDIDSGDIVYSVFKELDFATSLLKGPYRNSNFADAFRKARSIQDKNSFVLVDYKKYVPSYDAPASFIASPVWSGDKKIGIAIFQMPIDRLNAIMGERSGMGKTGETYLFGADKLMRSDSFIDSENYNVISSFKKPETGTLNSFSTGAILNNKSGHEITTNYKGSEVISAYSPIDILGLKWGLVAEISKEEAFASLYQIRSSILIIAAISCFVLAFFSFFLSSKLANRIQSIANKLMGSVNEVSKTSDSVSESSSQLSGAAVDAASSLQETVSSIDEISSMIQRNADAASNSTKVSMKSSEAATRGKKTVESMVHSINDISDSNDEIAKAMDQNNKDISKIVQVISEIGEKTKVINDIVFQTKLLSFNASVEAARAGEHGKGFAVVAEEVGNLASMSGKAALEITEMLDSSIKQVTEIVDSTKHEVEKLVSTSKEKVEVGTKTAHECGDALDEILQNVTSVNEMVREIASASNEQSTGVQEVTKAMQQLDETTHQNTSVAQESSSMAKNLKDQAEGLSNGVEDLMKVISGKGDFSLKNLESGAKQNVGSEDKVIQLPVNKKSSSKSVLDQKSLKVAGLDTEIPSASDSRFEDL